MNKEDMLSIRDLFTDAAKEVIEKNRIKAQMNKILQIVEVDKKRLQKAYAEIGQMYVEGTIDDNASRVQMLRGFIDHLNDRIKRAKIRYNELEKAHSVDECTQALKDELMVQLKNAKDTTADKAKDLSEKAKIKAQDISDKARDLTEKAKKAIKKDKGVELTEEQNEELLSLIEGQLSEDDEVTAEDAVEKVQELLKSLETEDETPEEEIISAQAEEESAEAEEKFDF